MNKPAPSRRSGWATPAANDPCGRLNRLGGKATVRKILMLGGAFGQAFDLGKLIISGLLTAALAACGATGDGRFTGAVVTSQGACGVGFDPQGKATATLLVRGSEVQFAPSDGVVVLPGHVDGAGHVLAGMNALGADKKPFPQVFDGSRDGEHVRGTYATPRCRASVDLTRD